MIRKLLIAGAASVGLLVTGCDSAVILAQDDGVGTVDPTTPTDPTDAVDPDSELADIVSTAEAAGNFTQLLAALESADLRDTLANAGNINTLFAPTDSAFEALGEEGVDALLADSEILSDTLFYHILSGSNDSAALTELAGTSITMLNGSPAALSLDDDQLLQINGNTIVTADITASNGIIHAIDAVLTPPEGATDPTTEPTVNIAQLLSDDPQFSTLATALTATGLDETLASDEVFTLFAPTDDAFAALEDGVLEALLNDPDTLTGLLLNHVVEGSAIDSMTIIAAADGSTILPADGPPLDISLVMDDLQISGVSVVEADLAATNGIVHAIDAVIMQ